MVVTSSDKQTNKYCRADSWVDQRDLFFFAQQQQVQIQIGNGAEHSEE